MGVGSCRADLVLTPGGVTPANSPPTKIFVPTSAKAVTLPAFSRLASFGSSDGLVPQVRFASEENASGGPSVLEAAGLMSTASIAATINPVRSIARSVKSAPRPDGIV